MLSSAERLVADYLKARGPDYWNGATFGLLTGLTMVAGVLAVVAFVIGEVR